MTITSTKTALGPLRASDVPTGPQHAPRGSERRCKSWAAEAAMRMLMNNLDPEVAEDPANLVVYGGIGKAARDWPSFQQIIATRLQDHRASPARLDRQLEPRRSLGDLGTLPRVGSQQQDDVRPDDGRFVDLHRHARHLAGDL